MKSPRKSRNSQPRRTRKRGGETVAGASEGAPTLDVASIADAPADPAGQHVTPVAVAHAASGPAEQSSAHETPPTPEAVTLDVTRATKPDRRTRAAQVVKDHVPLAVGAGMIPLPGVDLAAIGGLQLKLLSSLAALYEVPFAKAQARLIVTSLLGSVGGTVLVGAALGSVAKFVPFLGTLVGAASLPVAGGVITRAIGHLAIDHFEAGGTMETFDLDVAQQAFLDKIAEAKAAVA